MAYTDAPILYTSDHLPPLLCMLTRLQHPALLSVSGTMSDMFLLLILALAFPSFWNSFPPEIHTANFLTSFKSLSNVAFSMKLFLTSLFKIAIPSPAQHSQPPSLLYFLFPTAFMTHNIHTTYSWPLNNMGLTCMGPCICGFFSIVNTTVLHYTWLVESADMEGPWFWRNHVYWGPTISYALIFNCAEDWHS